MRSIFDDFIFNSPEFEQLISSFFHPNGPFGDRVIYRTQNKPIRPSNGVTLTDSEDTDDWDYDSKPIKVVPGNNISIRKNEVEDKRPRSDIELLDKVGFVDWFNRLPTTDRSSKHSRRVEREDEAPVKTHPFVFISNRMTFLIKTKYPVIFDTSAIKAKGEDRVFVAFDKHKNPKLDMREATKIANDVNYDEDIQNEVKQFLSQHKWIDIICSPSITWVNKEPRMGFMFTLVEKTKSAND